jgi:hypothetical protein
MIFLLPFGGIPDKRFHRVNDCFMPKWTRSIIIITDTLVIVRSYFCCICYTSSYRKLIVIDKIKTDVEKSAMAYLKPIIPAYSTKY